MIANEPKTLVYLNEPTQNKNGGTIIGVTIRKGAC